MTRLRRSFSLDFVNDDTATVFLNEDPDHSESSGRGSGSHHNHHHSLTSDPKCLLVRNHRVNECTAVSFLCARVPLFFIDSGIIGLADAAVVMTVCEERESVPMSNVSSSAMYLLFDPVRCSSCSTSERHDCCPHVQQVAGISDKGLHAAAAVRALICLCVRE
jgi:hypothetical protein